MKHINTIFEQLGYSNELRLQYVDGLDCIAEFRHDTIYVNNDYTNIMGEEFWSEVLLHEVAHYMSPSDNNHGSAFMDACEDIGCEVLNVNKMTYELAEQLLSDEDDFEIYYELN